MFISFKTLSTCNFTVPSNPSVSAISKNILLNLAYSFLLFLIALIMLKSLLVMWYIGKLRGPVCLTNLFPFFERLLISLRLLIPGNTPRNCGRSSIMLSTWSLTSPNVKYFTSSLSGFLSRFIGNSYQPLLFFGDFVYAFIRTTSFSNRFSKNSIKSLSFFEVNTYSTSLFLILLLTKTCIFRSDINDALLNMSTSNILFFDTEAIYCLKTFCFDIIGILFQAFSHVKSNLEVYFFRFDVLVLTSIKASLS